MRLSRWEIKYHPYYYFDSKDVSDKFLRPSALPSSDIEAELFDVVTDAKVAEGQALKYVTGKRAGLTKLVFAAMDEWFEEDEQIFDHPKSPYTVSSALLT